MWSNIEWRIGRPYLLLLPVLVAAAIIAKSYIPILNSCASVSDKDNRRIAGYLGKRFGLGDPNSIKIYPGTTLPGTCTRKLSVHSTRWKQDQTFFLSSDKRYLFRQADDLRHSPKEVIAPARDPRGPLNTEPSAIDMSTLVSGDLPSIGPKDAPVTIVEFSDFQCPYCRRLAATLKEKVLPEEKGKVRVVFHQFPLSFHSHAKEEAELSACVAHQNNSAFWGLYDYLFDHQELTKDGDIIASSFAFLRKQPGVNVDTVRTCMESHAMLSQVNKDIHLGEMSGVSGTPTLFINGVRMVGARDEISIKHAIDQATTLKASLGRSMQVGLLEAKRND